MGVKMSRRLVYLFTRGIVIISLFMCLSVELFAQGKIVGHVKDKTTNEPLIGVNIIILNTYLGAATDIEGDYVIVNVPVGVYSVQASMVGTAKVTQTNVIVSQNQTTQVDFELEQTAVLGEEVIVTAERNLLKKEVSSSQIVIDNRQLTEAAGVRTLQDFLATQAGVTKSDYLNIRGGLANETGTVINGLTFVNARVGKTEAFIPTSSIEQVSLKAGGMTAEYGDFRSGIINVTTKSGTNDGYHGSISFTRNLAGMKRFGKSLFDPMNNNLRGHLDPDISFIGVDEAVAQGYITSYDKQQLEATAFKGFKYWADQWNKNPRNPQVTAVDYYLLDAWMHMVNPDFDKLNAKIRELNAQGLAVGSEVTDENIKKLFDSHKNEEGKYADYNFDGGFGGPLPFVGKILGDATFYLSNITNRTSFIQPLELDYSTNSNTMLVLKSNVTKSITLKLTGSYGYTKGMSAARGADNEPPSLAGEFGTGPAFSGGNNNNFNANPGLDRGAFMPENNIPLYTSSGSNFGPIYWFYNTMTQPWEQKNYLMGVNLTHAISATTFYDFTLSYQNTKDYMDPSLSDMRDNTVLANFGPFPITEMPYGRRILPLGVRSDTIAGWPYSEYYSVAGLSERYGGKGGVVYDNSTTEQLRMKLNFGSQISKMHFVKAGVELFYMNLDNQRWAYWPGETYKSAYEYNFKVYPRTFGAYIQDEITFEDMVANVGIRMDHYSSGSLHWPTGQPFNTDVYGPNVNSLPSNWLEVLQSGRSITWERWDQIDSDRRAAGLSPLYEQTKTHTVFSPRFGISFPISERAKFYFNYGHFRQLPSYSEMYFYSLRWDKQGTFELGNPNLEPSKTIQYELGVDYNLLDQYLIHIAGYYKDITGEVRAIRYNDNSGTLNYNFRTNDRYRDIQGLEIQVTKSVGDLFTGWINFKYSYMTRGNTGRILVSENTATHNAVGSFYNADPNIVDPIPEVYANLTFKSPGSWGYFLGGWNLSLLPKYRAGEKISPGNTNPRGLEGVVNELYWPDYWMVDLKISKTFDLDFTQATVYIDVNNFFNNKIFLYNYAFAGGVGGTDYINYMKSLRLPEYSDPYYDPIRNEAAGEYLPGDDKIGDLRSSDKPYINDPNYDIFTFGQIREVWFGIKFDF